MSTKKTKQDAEGLLYLGVALKVLSSFTLPTPAFFFFFADTLQILRGTGQDKNGNTVFIVEWLVINSARSLFLF